MTARRSSSDSATVISSPSAQLGEDAEGRPPDGQLRELGVHAAEVVGAVVVGLLHLDPAHRQRLAPRAHRPEPAPPALGLAQEVDVDLDLVHLLHAADVRVPELLVRIDERAGAVDAGGRVDDLVAVHSAAPALDLVLRVEGQRLGCCATEFHHRDCGHGDFGLRKS